MHVLFYLILFIKKFSIQNILLQHSDTRVQHFIYTVSIFLYKHIELIY